MVKSMLDLKSVRQNPEALRTALKNRNHPEKPLDELVGLDFEWRKVKSDADNLKAERNKLSLEINEAKKTKLTPRISTIISLWGLPWLNWVV